LELAPKDLPGRYPGVRVGQPEDRPWGREFTIVDPGGACWHVRQATRNAYEPAGNKDAQP